MITYLFYKSFILFSYMIIQHYFIHFFYGKLKHYAEGRFMAPILILFNKTQSLKENLKERNDVKNFDNKPN